MLEDLDKSGPAQDGDLVQSILQDLNGSQPANPMVPMVQSNNPMASGAPAPPIGVRQPMQNSQGPLPSTFPNAADPALPTAHMIGRDHPTPADFQRMISSSGPLPSNSMMQQDLQMPASGPVAAPQMAPPPLPEEPKKNLQATAMDEIRMPIFVAIVIFVVTLPALNVLISHQAPKLLRPGGDLNTYGLLARALVGAALYWVLVRIVAPLINL